MTSHWPSHWPGAAEPRKPKLVCRRGESLRDVSARGEDLQVDYALADLDIRRGEMYVELARKDEARRLLERGLSGVKKVLAAMPDDENVQRLLADGTLALARAKD